MDTLNPLRPTAIPRRTLASPADQCVPELEVGALESSYHAWTSRTPLGPPLAAKTPVVFAELWKELVESSLRYCVTLDTPSGSVLVFRRGRRDSRHYAVTPREAAMLQRTLLGETQKEIAESERVAPSTASNCVRSAMVKMGFRSRMEMAPFAALAMSQRHKEGERSTRIFSAHQGEVIFAQADVDWDRGPRLTECESEIAKLILLGKSNQDIAIVRSTTVGTAQNQVTCLFRKFQVSGRFEFMRAIFDAIHHGPGGFPLPAAAEGPRHLTT